MIDFEYNYDDPEYVWLGDDKEEYPDTAFDNLEEAVYDAGTEDGYLDGFESGFYYGAQMVRRGLE
jgi:hypothetical protein